jgi:hypothetical protein
MLKGKGTLSSIQKNLLVDFGKIRDTSLFYLTGGPALAEFYLGHRRSYDLDFFTGKKELDKIKKPDINSLWFKV